MRYNEVIETAECGRVDRPLIRPEPFNADTKICVRFMAAVYRWIDLELELGAPDANISVEEASISFPELYSDDGTLTRDCRDWIIEMVQGAVAEIGLSMAVVFAADDAVYIWPRKQPLLADEPPSGGLLI